MNAVRELGVIDRLAGGLRRSPHQLNRRHESDAELLRLPGSEAILALTTDAVVEEIATGLYQDPWLIGWMAVTVNASDLAAVGADPLGILLSVTLPHDAPRELLAGLRRGFGDAADAHGLPVLGGDTNRGAALAVAGAAAGWVSGGRPLTRCGARPGDRLFASGPLGLGAAFAFNRLVSRAGDVAFHPLARLVEGQVLRSYASCGMDTSDGLITTLDELARRNACGFSIPGPIERILHPDALRVAAGADLPPWLTLAGPHGEFELAFSVSPDQGDALLDAAAANGWVPIELGTVTEAPGVVHLGDQPIDTTRLRNLFDDVGANVEEYVRAVRRSGG
jgi:thiamine-monophosphate kinase